MNHSFKFYSKLIAAIFISVTVYTSCTKEYKRFPIVMIPNDLRSMFLFDSGSYWIFQDSLTGDYDTLQCNSYWDDTSTSIRQNYFKESAFCGFKSNTSYHFENYSISIYTYGKTKETLTFENGVGFSLAHPFDEGRIYSYSNKNYNLYGDRLDTSIIFSKLPTYSINSFVFQKTMIVKVISAFHNPGDYKFYYYAKLINSICFR